MLRVCHMSSAHDGLDVRIFHRECVSIALAGYDTHLVIRGDEGDLRLAQQKGVTLHRLPDAKSRLSRIAFQGFRCFKIAMALNADIYHFHDPEMIPYGVVLALLGRNVIYDAHENVPEDILNKEWIPKVLRRFTSKTISIIETIGVKCFSAVIAATPSIAARFSLSSDKCYVLNNYPSTEKSINIRSRIVGTSEVCYIGGIAKIRGIEVVLDAIADLNGMVQLNLCGQFSDPTTEAACRSHRGWQYVKYFGQVNRAEVNRIMGRSIAGLVTFLPIPNHVNAMPNKMFEYMFAELPVVASDFPLWREIVAGNECGVCVNPLDATDIIKSIVLLKDNPDLARRMGINGKAAVMFKFNWAVEEVKLLELYAKIVSSSVR
jgi:glycosyltransferase involved in cell wall biosynthesis